MGSHGNKLAVSLFRSCARLRSRAHDFHYSIEKRCGKLERYVTFNEIHVLYTDRYAKTTIFWFVAIPISILFKLVKFRHNILTIQELATFQTLLQSSCIKAKSLKVRLGFQIFQKILNETRMMLNKLVSMDLRIWHPTFQFNIYIFRALIDI